MGKKTRLAAEHVNFSTYRLSTTFPPNPSLQKTNEAFGGD